MIVFPPVKINLGLYIVSKRTDGFHDLQSCFYPVQWTDVLEIVPSSEFSFIQTGLPVPGDQSQNICIKAVDLIRQHYNIPPVRLHLHKIIPMGAGLGGGSSDAAYTLTTLNSLFGLEIPEQELISLAARLGSDCAFFIRAEPALASSRGEVLRKISLTLKGSYIVIVCPDIHVSTKDAFAGVKPAPLMADLAEIIQNRQSWKEQLHNQFEDTVFPVYPRLKQIKDELYRQGAFYASMSGSGSAIYGLFEKEPTVSFTPFSTFIGKL